MPVWRHYDQAALDAQYGTRWQLGAGFDAWQEACRSASRATCEQLSPRCDIAYGPGPRQKLDIFPAPAGGTPPPVAIFIHGGFWRARDKSDYSFVAAGLRSLGAMPVLINYPLCPAATLDEVVASVREAVSWVIDHIAHYGGDPHDIWIVGHSAGAHLAAMACASTRGAGTIKGAMLTSGLYELEPIRLCFVNADIRLDAAQVERLSPARLSPAIAAPLLLAVGGDESEEFTRQADDFAAAWAGQGVPVTRMTIRAVNHYTMIDQLATPGSELLRRFAELVGGFALR